MAAEGLTSAYLPPIPAGDRGAPGFAAALAAANCGYSTLLPSFLSPQLKCDGSNISPVALNILKARNPDGTYYFPGSGTSGYAQRVFSIPAQHREDQVVASGDYVLNSKNTISARYFYTSDPQESPLAGQLPGTPKHLYYSNTYSVLKLTSIISSTLVNEARVSYSYSKAVNTDTMPIGAQYPLKDLGMIPIQPALAHPPQMILVGGGYTMFGNLDPLNSPTHQIAGADQISWSHGKHTIHTGFEYERFRHNLTNVWLSQLQKVPVPPTGPTTSGDGFVGYVVPANYTEHYGAPPAGVYQNTNNSGIRLRTPLSNFGPRIGVAWQPVDSGKVVVRAGAGLFYDRVSLQRFAGAYGNNNPYAVALNYSFPNNQTLADPFPHTPLGFSSRWANFATGETSALNTPFVNEVIHTPVVRQYNFNVQYEFAPTWVLEVGFVGSSGINLVDFAHNYNTALLASPTNPVRGLTTSTLENINLRTPYLGITPAGLGGTGST